MAEARRGAVEVGWKKKRRKEKKKKEKKKKKKKNKEMKFFKKRSVPSLSLSGNMAAAATTTISRILLNCTNLWLSNPFTGGASGTCPSASHFPPSVFIHTNIYFLSLSLSLSLFRSPSSLFFLGCNADSSSFPTSSRSLFKPFEIQINK